MLEWHEWLTIGLGLLAALVAIYSVARKREGTRVAWSVRGQNLVANYGEAVSDLSITFAGESVENLTVSKIAIWNAGTDTINSTDLVEGDLLRIVAETDARLLNVSVIQENNPPNEVRLDIAADQHSAVVDFRFLDSGNGIVAQVFHTGVRGKALSVEGYVV